MCVLLQAVVAESRRPSRCQPHWRTPLSRGRGHPQSPSRSQQTLHRTFQAPTRVTKGLPFRGLRLGQVPRPEPHLTREDPHRAHLRPSIPHHPLPLDRRHRVLAHPSPDSPHLLTQPDLLTTVLVPLVLHQEVALSLSVDRVLPGLRSWVVPLEEVTPISPRLDSLSVDTNLECPLARRSVMDLFRDPYLPMGSCLDRYLDQTLLIG
ncbi:hypothetical protein J6590_015600 [Homalodisca vitripennis]|nr:hypothetical protein J6590_015600 [Homalodisca vitripennis]